MVFMNLIRHSKYPCNYKEKLQFFQSSYFNYYFNNNSLARYYFFYNTNWANGGPHPSNRGYAEDHFLSIDNGHYGLYYSMYNHDSERKSQQVEDERYIVEYLVRESKKLQQYCICENINHIKRSTIIFMKLFNLDVHHNFKLLKKFTNVLLLSTSSFICGTNADHHHHHQVIGQKLHDLINTASSSPFLIHVRNFTTFNPLPKDITLDEEKIFELVNENQPLLEENAKITQIQKQSPAPVQKSDGEDILNVSSDVASSTSLTTSTEIESNDSFEESLLNSQISNILSTYANYSKPEELNIIYPLFQSLKRNDLSLPNIDLYNVVLNSIEKRALDSELSLEAIENKLTTLLTIYQDVLGSGVKPNFETYNIVLSNLLQGSLNCHALLSNNQFYHVEIINKGQEFTQVALELLMSIKNLNHLNLNVLIPNFIKALNLNPSLLNKEIIELLMDHLPTLDSSSSFNNVNEIIKLTNHFTQFNIFNGDSKQIYEYILSLYESYKVKATEKENEFIIYANLIDSLIRNNQFQSASEFLDDILFDYKESLEFHVRPSKEQISLVISTYLNGIINNTKANNVSLLQTYELLTKFNRISYIPDVSVSVYNSLIHKYIQYCNELSVMKDKSELHQQNYKVIGSLYDYVAIRKDYQATPTVQFVKDSNSVCRESLLDKSIDMGDHERVFQLIKEILLKNHLIYDLSIFKKLLNYLYNGVMYNKIDANGEPFNQYYFGLIWNLIETQSIHYEGNSRDLSDFLSEFVNYLIIIPQLPTGTFNVSTVTYYNIQLIMNSLFINRLVDQFDLQKDSVYGLVLISKFLMTFENQDLTTANKILQYQAKLINQFEDSDNHYIELGSNLQEFKVDLINHFKSLINQNLTNDDIELSTTILDACTMSDIKIPYETKAIKNDSLNLNYDLNLSYLLNVSYKAGVAQFIELFNKGYNFSSMTWEIMINYNFINEYLEKNSSIRARDFIERIWASNFNHELKIELMTRLMNIQSDKTNIKIFEILNQNPSLMLNGTEIDNKLLGNLFQMAKESSNVYFKKLISNPEFFDNVYAINSQFTWVDDYLSLLKELEEYQLIIQIVDQFEFNNTVDKEFNQTYFKVIINYLNALLKTRSLQAFNTTFQQTFMQRNQSYLHERELIELLINYNLMIGSNKSIEMINESFIKYANLSTNIRENLALARLINNLKDDKFEDSFKNGGCLTVKEFSIRLLSGDLGQMIQLYNSNQAMLVNKATKSEFIGYIFNTLIEVSESRSNIEKSIIYNKFNTVMKFLQMNQFKSLSSDNLTIIIQLLTKLKSTEVLHFLLMRLLVDNNKKFTNVLNFYFMEVQLLEYKDKLKTLYWLNKAFKYLKDDSTIRSIKQFCKLNSISLPKLTQDEFITSSL
ncbi:RNase P subunit [Scheffersomyces coipomensis]|uniref:RNase P subunit n=1 Tax=Scheffersomyces coipomensis TaxID=1788519 RepID=UPI00315D7B2D